MQIFGFNLSLSFSPYSNRSNTVLLTAATVSGKGDESDISPRNVRDLTGIVEKPEGWGTWAWNGVKDFLWEMEVCLVINIVFDRLLWPVFQVALSSNFVTGNLFVMGAFRAFMHGMFMAGCKNLAKLGLLEQFFAYLFCARSPKQKEAAPKDYKVVLEECFLNYGVLSKGIFKFIAYAPQQLVIHIKSLRVSKSYFSAAMESFYKNEENYTFIWRSLKAFKVGLIAGTRKTASEYLTDKQCELTQQAFVWVANNFGGQRVGDFIRSIFKLFENKENLTKSKHWDSQYIYQSAEDKGRCYFNTYNPAVNSWEKMSAGKCEVDGVIDDKNWFYNFASDNVLMSDKKSRKPLGKRF